MILIYTKNNENFLKHILEYDVALKEYDSLLEQYGDDISSMSLVVDDIAFFSRDGNPDGWEAIMTRDYEIVISEEDHNELLEQI